MNISTLSQTLRDKRGFSYSLDRGDCLGLPFYAIGRKGNGKEYDTLPTTEQISEYIKESSAILAGSDSCIGGWEYKGRYYLDISLLVPKEIGLEEALEMGRRHGQLAIFDLETGTEIETGHA